MQASVLHGSIFRKWTLASRRLAWLHLPKIIEKMNDMTLGCARVPKIIPMQGQGGLRGPSFWLHV